MIIPDYCNITTVLFYTSNNYNAYMFNVFVEPCSEHFSQSNDRVIMTMAVINCIINWNVKGIST